MNGKLSLILLLALGVAAFGMPPLDPDCVRVMTDCGCDLACWNMTSSWKTNQIKRLNLQVPLKEIASAFVEYELLVGPFDPKTKQRNINSKDYPWGNWQIRVNGRLVLDQPAAPYITKDTHVVEIPVDALKQGENLIEIGWAKDATRVGYVYFACDLTEASKAVIDYRERAQKYPEGVRVRLILRLK